MAVIKSGATTDELTIDATSKAARITEYNSSGTELKAASTGYLAKIGLGRITTAVAASSFIWIMRNAGPKVCRIKQVVFTVGMAGDTVTSTAVFGFAMARGTATTAAPSGGAVLSTTAKKSSSPVSQCTVRNASTALTVSNISFEEAFCQLDVSAYSSVASIVDRTLNLAANNNDASLLEVASTECFGIRVSTQQALTTGALISGTIVWDEV